MSFVQRKMTPDNMFAAKTSYLTVKGWMNRSYPLIPLGYTQN